MHANLNGFSLINLKIIEQGILICIYSIHPVIAHHCVFVVVATF